ncbi:MAG: hypothetical protein KIT65_10920 [Xanthobacteraceae bacterium]|nr:hypothetical protein [Xanthobacteraceae bacterium]
MGAGYQPKDSGPRGTPPIVGSAATKVRKIMHLSFKFDGDGLKAQLKPILAQLKEITKEADRAKKAIAALKKSSKSKKA